jgi:hypothetical protein
MPSRSPIAGGAPLALSIVAGAVIGFIAGQPTLGILIGAGVGIALALVVWLRG